MWRLLLMHLLRTQADHHNSRVHHCSNETMHSQWRRGREHCVGMRPGTEEGGGSRKEAVAARTASGVVAVV